MRKIIIAFITVFLFNFSFGQKIQDTISYKIEQIGNKGGQYITNMGLDSISGEIFINIYSHIEGEQIIVNPEKYEEAKKAERKNKENKSIIVKLLNTILDYNGSEYAILPIVQEIKLDLEVKNIQKREGVFYKAKNIPKDNKVFFRMNRHSNYPFSEKDILEYGYSQVKNVFHHFPSVDTLLYEFSDINYKGEGVLGLKDLSPKIVKKELRFEYDPQRGFVTNPIVTEVSNAIDEVGDSESKLIDNSVQIGVGISKTYSWYENEESNDFKMMMYDINSKEKKIINFNFQNKRKPVILNKTIYDTNGNKVGFLSIFRYHRKQDKKKKKYTKENFSLVITDLEAKVVYNNTINYGDGKSFKNILSPIYVIKRDENTFDFLNFNMRGLLKFNIEKCQLDIGKNTIVSMYEMPSSLKTEEGLTVYPHHVLNNYDNVYKYSDSYVFVKAFKNEENKFSEYCIAITDSDFNSMKVFKSSSAYEGKGNSLPIKTYKIRGDKDELILLDQQGASFGLTKISKEKIIHTSIRTPYAETYSLENYYGDIRQKSFLNDSKNRILYLFNQHYYTSEYVRDKKIIDMIGITKISY